MNIGVKDKIALTAAFDSKVGNQLRDELHAYVRQLSSTSRNAGMQLNLVLQGMSVKLPEPVATWLSAFERRVDHAMSGAAKPPTFSVAEEASLTQLFKNMGNAGANMSEAARTKLTQFLAGHI